MGFGEGEEKLSEESLSSPSPTPTLSSSKTFVFIESLFAGSAGTVLKEEGKRHQDAEEIRFSEDADQQANSGGKASVSPPHQSKVFGEGAGGGAF